MSKYYTKIKVDEVLVNNSQIGEKFSEKNVSSSVVLSYDFNNVNNLGQDSSGNGRTGTVNSATSTASLTAGTTRTNVATFASGQNISMLAYESTIRAMNGCSISVWFRVTNFTSTTQNIYEFNRSGGGIVFRVWDTAEDPLGIHFGILNEAGNTWVLRFIMYGATGTESNLGDGNWHHFVIVLGTGGNIAYIDNNVLSSQAGSGTPYSRKFFTGSSSATTSTFSSTFTGTLSTAQLGSTFAGSLDKFAIFNTRLTAAQVNELYNENSTTNMQFLVNDGTVTYPTIRYKNATTTGFYRIGAANVGITIGGTKYSDISTNITNISTNCGINISTPDKTQLDIYGVGNTANSSSLRLRAGNTSAATTANQIECCYNGTALDYRNCIKTRHNSGATTGNAIDFYTWNQGTDSVTTSGTKHNVTMQHDSMGIDGITDPKTTLHVGNSIAITTTTHNDNYHWLLSWGDEATDPGNLNFAKVLNGAVTSQGNVEDDSGVSNSGNYQVNFTGQHKCRHINDTITNQNSDKYIGKIVYATGSYKTQTSATEIKEGKDAIFITETIPTIEICSIAMDKRVFGVISHIEDVNNPNDRRLNYGNFGTILQKPPNDRRISINSVGEGAIWICNKNGNFVNGDCITSSSIKGYGQKQNDNKFYNYTVAKITCDCDFQYNSQNYELKFIDLYGNEITEQEYIENGGYKSAFVGCTYHCG